MYSWNWEKIKLFISNFNKCQCLFLFHEKNKRKSLFLFHGWFPLEFIFTDTIFLWRVKISTWVNQEKNMSCKHSLNFDQWKTLSKNYRPMRVWLWFVYKFTKNYFSLRLFSKFDFLVYTRIFCCHCSWYQFYWYSLVYSNCWK